MFGYALEVTNYLSAFSVIFWYSMLRPDVRSFMMFMKCENQVINLLQYMVIKTMEINIHIAMVWDGSTPFCLIHEMWGSSLLCCWLTYLGYVVLIRATQTSNSI